MSVATWSGLLFRLLVTLGFLLAGCIQVGPSPFYDYHRLDLVKGQVELVVPAEAQPTRAETSPDGRWLAVEFQDYHVNLLDVQNNQMYENVTQGGPVRWLNNEYMAVGAQILRVSDMAHWTLHSLEGYYEDHNSLRELADAQQIYAVDGLASGYKLVTTDPAYPYILSIRGTGEVIDAKLADKPHTIITRDVSSGWTAPAYSPDGKYYIKNGPFDEPGSPRPEAGGIMYDASGQAVAYGYKYVWSTYFLGWAADSSGAYFLYMPRTPEGDAIYRKWPIYKVLVPGAQLRGTPAPATLTPPSTFTPAPASATPVGQSDCVICGYNSYMP